MVRLASAALVCLCALVAVPLQTRASGSYVCELDVKVVELHADLSENNFRAVDVTTEMVAIVDDSSNVCPVETGDVLHVESVSVLPAVEIDDIEAGARIVLQYSFSDGMTDEGVVRTPDYWEFVRMSAQTESAPTQARVTRK